MCETLRRPCAPVASALLFACLALSAGCQPVREDRTISFSGQGNKVGFQHGQEGVFVADKEGGGLTKVFQPGPDVLAVSTPLWAPKDRRLIFTTARAADGNAGVTVQWPATPDPAGNVVTQRPVVYTCWLRRETAGGKPPEPVPLFEAACDHVGYVAANLAVRWHPDGNRILYVKAVGAHHHGLFEYDLVNKVSREVFPQTADALVFDWAPDNEHLVCVLGNHERTATDGIWIGRPGGDWWPVPDSAALAEGQLPSLLEQLRATQPAWTADGARFAFASYVPGVTKEQPGRHFVRVGTLADRCVRTLAEGKEPFRDLRWAPDGSRLGVVAGRELGSLHLVRDEGGLSPPLARRPVRLFAGWDHDGKHLAYVVPESQPAPAETWSFLLMHEPLARDVVYLSDSQGTGAGKEVLAGMRVTFPHWSPTEERLSLWVTFSPAYRSWVSRLIPLVGVRLGDPAATLDPAGGKLSWMAVNADEKAQVGNYYLLKHQYAEAWRWYEKAAKERGPAPDQPPPPDLHNLDAFLGARDTAFFEYLCLTKLDRHDDAQARLKQFHHDFLRLPADDRGPLLSAPVGEQTVGRQLRTLLAPESFAGALLRDLYMGEAFLSVDQAAEGEAFFRQALREAKAEPARLSHALTLSQFLLVQRKNDAYAELASATIVPLLFRTRKAPPPSQVNDLTHPKALQQWAEMLTAQFALLPLCADEFTRTLSAQQAKKLVERWQALAVPKEDENNRMLTDLLLLAAYRRLGMEKECAAVARRLEQAPPANGQIILRADIDAAITELRRATAQLPH
jgi:hypothetical protein